MHLELDRSEIPGHLLEYFEPVSSLKSKDLCMIPARVALALQADGWWLRSDIIWSKGNPMPESVTDRPTKSHEYIFLLTKSQRYFYDHVAIQEKSATETGESGKFHRTGPSMDNDRHPAHGTRKQDAVGKNTYTGFNNRYKPLAMRNKRDVWTVPTQPYLGIA